MRRHQPSSFYGDDLAYIHDVGFAGFADGTAPALLDLLHANAIDTGLVVDLGCGSGIWARHLTDAGYQVLGIDIAPAMIALARKRAPDAEFHVASCLDFPLPSCQAITALGEVLCYISDDSQSRNALPRFLQKAAAALQPGGVLIFDIIEVGTYRQRAPSFRATDNWACLVRSEYDDKTDQLTRHITSFRQVGDLYRREEEAHRVQFYRRSEIAAMLRKAGLRVRTMRRFGQYDLLSGRVGFVARKPLAA